MGGIKKAIILFTLICGSVLAGEAGQYGRSLQLRNWLIGNDVQMTDSINLFLSLPDAVPIDDSTGLIQKAGVWRTANNDKTRGWINQVVFRRRVEENGHPGYWVYHIHPTLVFDLTKDQQK